MSTDTRDINTWPYNGEGGITQNYLHSVNAWTETNEEAFYDQLGCVPPIRQDRAAFMVGECYCFREGDGARMYAAFVEVNGRYFGQIKALRTFDPAAYTTEIVKQFQMEENHE